MMRTSVWSCLCAMTLLLTGGASAQDEAKVVWDGQDKAGGQSWVSPEKDGNSFAEQSKVTREGSPTLRLSGDGGGWIGGGWNWYGWWPQGAGTDVSGYQNLAFYIKVDVADDKPLGTLDVWLVNSSNDTRSATLSVADYVDGKLADGQWHEVVIPLADLKQKADGFDWTKVWEMDLGTWSGSSRKFDIYVDDIRFDSRDVAPRSQAVSEARPRPAPTLTDPMPITADVTLSAQGTPISPYIYGAAMGKRALANEMGLTILRAGGNPLSPHNWKLGVSSKGKDWFFQNEGTAGSASESWLVRFHGENRKHGLATYLSLPTMGRVAKDGHSVAFDTGKYPDQESWAGKVQPGDRLPHAGSGVRVLKGPDRQPLRDDQGRARTELIEPDPEDTSIAMSPEEQVEALRYMIEDVGYGTAKEGGIRYVALDNEPFLWHTTHRGMHPRALGYDDLWEMTRTYASLIKAVDPDVQIAGPTLWGWTAYFYSGLDSQLIEQGKGTWDNPPDFAAHGGVYLLPWWLTKLYEHEQATGQRLIDILDIHFYPQVGIYPGQPGESDAKRELRMQQTRVLWDPDYDDPSWMGRETDGQIALLRLMKRWIAEHNPGLGLAIGEYSFGGERDLSGGVAQAEVLGVFAREGVDHAYYWFFPPTNSTLYFAFKMFRNPDGEQTAVGDRYLPVRNTHPADVSIHPIADPGTGRLSLVLTNLRIAQDARVTVNFDQPLPAQNAVLYEYSERDKMSIGRLPAQRVEGRSVTLALPAMSVLRVDLTR